MKVTIKLQLQANFFQTFLLCFFVKYIQYFNCQAIA